MNPQYTDILNFAFVTKVLDLEARMEVVSRKPVNNMNDTQQMLHIASVSILRLAREQLQALREGTVKLDASMREAFYENFYNANIAYPDMNDGRILTYWEDSVRHEVSVNQKATDILGYRLCFVQHVGDWHDGHDAGIIVAIDREDRFDPYTWARQDRDGTRETVGAALDMLHGLNLLLIGGVYSSYDGMEWDFEKIEVRQAATKYQLTFERP